MRSLYWMTIVAAPLDEQICGRRQLAQAKVPQGTQSRQRDGKATGRWRTRAGCCRRSRHLENISFVLGPRATRLTLGPGQDHLPLGFVHIEKRSLNEALRRILLPAPDKGCRTASEQHHDVLLAPVLASAIGALPHRRGPCRPSAYRIPAHDRILLEEGKPSRIAEGRRAPPCDSAAVRTPAIPQRAVRPGKQSLPKDHRCRAG